MTNHVVCYCDDCQAYLHHIGAPELLDAYGGTDIAQMSVARVRIEGGWEHVACTQLRPGGMHRYHTTCCHTPMVNLMASPRFPFAGVISAFCDHGGVPTEVHIGRPVGIQGRFATGDVSALGVHPRAPGWLGFRIARLVAGWWWAGDAARNAFIVDGKPRVEPTVVKPA